LQARKTGTPFTNNINTKAIASVSTTTPRQVGTYTCRRRNSPRQRVVSSIANRSEVIWQNGDNSKQIRVRLDFSPRDKHIGAA
jgi:hypothetical protein